MVWQDGDQTLYRVGGYFRANNYTANTQAGSSTTGLSDGGFVVTWTSNFGQDGDDQGVYGQRYDSDGNKVGNEFRINTYTTRDQSSPSVASLSDGGFVVTWESSNQDSDNSGGIYGQRYDSNGNTVGNEFQVNTYVLYSQWHADVAALSNGGFVVVWLGRREPNGLFYVYGQRYDAESNTMGDEFQVMPYANAHWYFPSVAGLSGGGFVVVSTADGQDGDGYGIYGKQFGNDGNAIGNEFQVNNATIGDQKSPLVTALSDGGFVVTWEGEKSDFGIDGINIYGQRYNSNGYTMGNEFLVNTYVKDSQESHSTAALSDGGFVVTWGFYSGRAYVADRGVYARQYDIDGNPVGKEFRVDANDTIVAGDNPAVAGLSNGGFVIMWDGYQDQTDGLYSTGIYGQRFALGTLATTISPTAPSASTMSTLATAVPTVDSTKGNNESAANANSGNLAILWFGILALLGVN